MSCFNGQCQRGVVRGLEESPTFHATSGHGLISPMGCPKKKVLATFCAQQTSYAFVIAWSLELTEHVSECIKAILL
jgi:hypothetical protein